MAKFRTTRVVSASDARQHLPDIVAAVEQREHPILITRHGKTVVAVIPAHWLEQIGYSSNTGHLL